MRLPDRWRITLEKPIPVSPDSAIRREKLESDIEAFLAAGGEIKQMPIIQRTWHNEHELVAQLRALSNSGLWQSHACSLLGINQHTIVRLTRAHGLKWATRKSTR